MAWRGNDPAIEFRDIESLREYITGLDYKSWRPSNFVVHNTASPTLDQWWNSGTSPEQRMKNLQDYYENELGWSAGPHFFIDGESWWVMTPPNVKGVHSPSWNGTMLGFEHVGDYEIESADEGLGRQVQNMGYQLSAICCEFFGWSPENLKFHYEDPNTDHACPGSNMIKSTYVDNVLQVMGEGGDAEQEPLSKPWSGEVGDLATGDTLNIRAGPSSTAPIIGEARNGDILTIVGEAWNGSTKWLRCKVGTAAGAGVALYGWCAARYVAEVCPDLPSSA
jgi:SH3 domain-containing protein/N-acetylmuramoyl-L-alanine amidase-like protein